MPIIKEIKFEASCYLESSWGQKELGVLPCSMTLSSGYREGYSTIYFKAGENATYIGVFHDKNKVIHDYDGIFSIPKQAVDLLKSCGYDTDQVN